MIFTVDLLPTNQTLLSTENYGRTAQLSPHQARTAATSAAPPSTLGPFGPDGARPTESQSPDPSAKSDLGKISPSLSLQQLFPISSSSSLQGPDVSTYVLNCQVTSCLLVIRAQSQKVSGIAASPVNARDI